MAEKLIESDMERARRDFRLLAEALGENGNDGNRENMTGQSGPDGDE